MQIEKWTNSPLAELRCDERAPHADSVRSNCSQRSSLGNFFPFHGAFARSCRQPLQEIHQDAETPSCVREILSPMSVDKSMLESGAATDADREAAVQQLAIDQRLAVKAELDHFFEVDEYRQDILEYLLEAEQSHRPKPMYMRKQPDISHSMRTVLIDWLVEVGEEYRLQSETLCLAVSYIDRFLSVMSVVRAKLQLVGTAAMFIAAKYEEIYPPDVGEFVYITDNTYTKTQVLRMEQLILKVLKFDLCVPTTSIFLNAYPVTSNVPKEVKYLSQVRFPLSHSLRCLFPHLTFPLVSRRAQFFCELSLLEAEPYLQFTPSVVSASAVALARYNFGHPIWSQELENVTGYKVETLTEVILHLAESHRSSVNSPQQAVQDKYKASKYVPSESAHLLSNVQRIN